MSTEIQAGLTDAGVSTGSEAGGFDFAGAVDEISEGLGFGGEEEEVSLEVAGDKPGTSKVSAEPSKDPKAAAASTQTPAPGATDPTAPKAPEPPKTWRKEAVDQWAQVPDAVKTEILKREEDMFRGLEGYKQQAQVGKSVQEILGPYMPALQHYQIDPMQQIAGLMRSHYTLAMGSPEDKLALMHQIISDYKIDLDQLVSTRAPYVDPTVASLQKQFQSLQSEVQSTRAREVQAAQQRVTSEVEAFATDPKNEFFDLVADDMTALIKSGVAKSLQDAYDRAVWTNPQTRSTMLQRQTAQQQAEAAAQTKAHAERARNAVSSQVQTGSKVASAAAPLGSLDDTLSETLAAIRGRG